MNILPDKQAARQQARSVAIANLHRAADLAERQARLGLDTASRLGALRRAVQLREQAARLEALNDE